MFYDNYSIAYYDDGIDIELVNEDVFELDYLNSEMVRLLNKYNDHWVKTTGLTPKYYAAHGTFS